VADPLTLHRAIVAVAIAIGGARCADFQVYDGAARVLRMGYQMGFPHWLVAFFATVDAAQPTACGAVLATRKPMLVTDVSRSPIFDRAGRDAVLAADSRTVYSYPLQTSSGTVLGGALLPQQHTVTAHRPSHAGRPRRRPGTHTAVAVRTVARPAGSTYIPVVMAVVTFSSHRSASNLALEVAGVCLPAGSRYRARQWPSDRLAMLAMVVLLLGGQGRAPFRLDPRDQILFG
jgi:hypothetical protein